MSDFIDLKALGGTHFVKPSAVIAVQFTEPQKCTVLLAGGGSLSCAEPAAQVRARLDAALSPPTSETSHGDASR